MLLSIDRVLQLLGEGKPLEKIADLADCTVDDVQGIIEDCREIMKKHEKPRSKKKIILKKQKQAGEELSEKSFDEQKEIFEGAELTAVPLGSTLTIYTDGASKGNPGPAGIGVVIYDSDDRQVGKVSSSIGYGTNNYAEYTAVIRALRIAIYFETKNVKLRTDSELIVKQIKGEYAVKHPSIKKLYDQVTKLIKKIPDCKVEHVTRNLNEKADYLSKKASQIDTI